MKLFAALTIFLLLYLNASAQDKQLVYTADIDHFRTAYDSAETTSDTLKQQQFFQRVYVDRASDGLKEFMQDRDYSAQLYIQLLSKYPKF